MLRRAVQRVQEEARMLRVRAAVLQRVPAARRRNDVRAVPAALDAPALAQQHRSPEGPRPAMLPQTPERLDEGLCRYVNLYSHLITYHHQIFLQTSKWHLCFNHSMIKIFMADYCICILAYFLQINNIQSDLLFSHW